MERLSIVRKQDVAIAKNYLNFDEIKDLNEIVTMYLDYAERQARQRKTVMKNSINKEKLKKPTKLMKKI